MKMDCEKYAGKCVCGREHVLETKKVVVEYGALEHFEEYMEEVGLAGKRRVVVYDTMVYQLTEGKHVIEMAMGQSNRKDFASMVFGDITVERAAMVIAGVDDQGRLPFFS